MLELGTPKTDMLSFNPKHFMAVVKEVRTKKGLKGPERCKGAKGGLFRSHCDLLGIIINCYINHY